jgi:glycosyltransferase involved in cell wall biosynthesis
MRQEEYTKLNVCYILPDISENSATHVLHKYELMRELDPWARFFVYQPSLGGIIKMVFARLYYGCRLFYVHYSFKGALIAILITKLFGGAVYYWNCGMPWLYERSTPVEWLFRFVLRNTLFVTATDELAAEYVVRYEINPFCVRVVPNYIRVRRMQSAGDITIRARLNIPTSAYVVLFLHRLSRRKGADILPDIIENFYTANSSSSEGIANKDVLFLIVGDGPEYRNLETKIRRLGGAHAIRLVGSVPNADVPLYMAAADIYLMPSEEEGMPNALLEAMAAGVPYVASDVAAVKEMSPPIAEEFILPYGDTRAFAEAVKKLLVDENLRKRISAEEQEWVKRYDVSVIAPRFLEMIRDI